MNRKLICALLANLFSGAAFAQEASDEFRVTGSVGIGGMSVNTDGADKSYRSEYQDISSGVLTNFGFRGRGARSWIDGYGENLGRDDQYIAFRGGMYDVFKYSLSSDALRHNMMFNGLTPCSAAGSATQTAAFPSRNAGTWNSLDVGYKRRNDAAMFEYQGRNPWYLRADANQVTWKGTKVGSSSQGMSPGNGFVELALPVDYTTRNFTAEGGYNSRAMHFDLSWMSSKFDNENETVNWTNGYFGNGTDRTRLAADNNYRRIAGNAVFRHLPAGTTISARFTSDKLESTVPLDTTVLNGTAGQIAATGPNVSTFDGNVKNDTFTISATSTPVKALDTRLYYNYRKRNDESTSVTFSSTAIPGPESNVPYSYKTNNWGFDAYYRLNRANRLGAGYDYNDTDREGRPDYDNTRDKRFFAEWRNSSLDELGARLKYQRLERESNFLLGNSGASPTDVAYWDRYVTPFDLSNVEQDLWKLTLDYTPVANLDFGFEAIIKKNNFKDNTLGRLKDDRREVYLTASYQVPGTVRVTIFGDSEEVKYDSTHRVVGSGSTSGAYEPSTAPNASNYNWSGRIRDRNWAAGIAVDLPATDKLTIKASAIYYKTDGGVDLALQDGVPGSVTRPVPISEWDDSKRTSFNLKGVYVMSKVWTFTFGYAYEKYDYRDSQVDGYRNTVTASSNQDSSLSGVGANPQYKSNLVYGLANYTF